MLVKGQITREGGQLRRLGHYEVVRRVAVGGMAELYLARAVGIEGFEKLVALKRLLPHFADDRKYVSMFLDEARLAGSLQHPNVAQVFDVGESGGSYYLAMEYVEGHDLRELIQRSDERDVSIPPGYAVAMTMGVLAGLHYAHTKRAADGSPLGIVHRDVSPSNIVLGFDGAIKLIDFGIAKTTVSSMRTKTGTIKGKIAYMSPEQCTEEPVDARSDVFSMGTVLYEILTLTRPFEGDNDYQVLRNVIETKPPSLRSLNAMVPARLESIVLRALEKRPGDRYQSALEFQEDLRACVRDLQLSCTPYDLAGWLETVCPRVSTLPYAGEETATDASVGPISLALSDETPAIDLSATATRPMSPSSRRARPAVELDDRTESLIQPDPRHRRRAMPWIIVVLFVAGAGVAGYQTGGFGILGDTHIPQSHATDTDRGETTTAKPAKAAPSNAQRATLDAPAPDAADDDGLDVVVPFSSTATIVDQTQGSPSAETSSSAPPPPQAARRRRSPRRRAAMRETPRAKRSTSKAHRSKRKTPTQKQATPSPREASKPASTTEPSSWDLDSVTPP